MAVLGFENISEFFDTDEFAEAITYTASGGSPKSITAVVDRSDAFQEAYEGSGKRWALAEITLQASDVTAPGYNDRFTGGSLGSESWEVDPSRGVFYTDTNIHVVALRRLEEG